MKYVRQINVCIITALLLAHSCHALADAGLIVMHTGNSAVLGDAQGNIIIAPGTYAGIEPLGEGELFAVQSADSGSWAVADASGEPLTAFVYDKLEYVSEEIVFQRDGLWGCMDEELRITIEPKYTRLVPVGDGFLALKSNPLDDTPDALYLLDEQGAEHSTGIQLSYGPLAASDGLCEAQDTLGRWGYLNENGWAIEPACVWCGAFLNSRAVAMTQDGAGIIDENGAWIVNPAYRRISRGDGSADVALCCRDGGVDLVDVTDGHVIAAFDDADAYLTGGMAALTQGGAMSLLYPDGTLYMTLPEGTAYVSQRSGYVIAITDAADSEPFALILPDGTQVGRYQELGFAGQADADIYFMYATYDTEAAAYANATTLFDEVNGTRRYHLMDADGAQAGEEYLSLRRMAGDLLAAETDDWIGVIRPNGDVVFNINIYE